LDKSELDRTPPRPVEALKLRILLIVNLEWDSRLGAVRVFMELAEQWRAAGHTVEKYSFSEAFKQPASPPWTALRQILFGFKAAAFVRRHASRFDVVDALIGSLHGSKEKLEFDGLLVARSVGLYRLYERFELMAQKRWPSARGKWLTKVFYENTNRWFRRLCDASLRNADVFNLPNEEEKQFLKGEGFDESIMIVQPYGVAPERRTALAHSAMPAARRLDRMKICFVGMWAPRKGSRDWAEILRLIWLQLPEARFSFLGVMVDPAIVMRDLGLRFSERIEIIPEYSQVELPELLSDCAIGAFPSYVEGFGIAVLEQLAAGIPTVAFDVAGPRDMLARISDQLLVPAGDIPKFAETLIRLLRSEMPAYIELSGRCTKVAAKFSWPLIAKNTAANYQDYLAGRPAKASHHDG
jgi:glycosyltransferase involved in cell wall biosynthesis